VYIYLIITANAIYIIMFKKLFDIFNVNKSTTVASCCTKITVDTDLDDHVNSSIASVECTAKCFDLEPEICNPGNFTDWPSSTSVW